MSVADAKPRVAIGLPVCNGERFLRQALDSLLAQDSADFELIISDNASTDLTGVICREYAGRDRRIRYHRNAMNIGPTANFNRVFELSSADYFMWAAADDEWAPNYVSSCLDALGKSPTVVLAGTMGRLVDAETAQSRLVDPGFSTVGLSAMERFQRYKSTIHNGEHVGTIFYGIYRRSALDCVVPMRNVIANDHLLLATLSLLGEFQTVSEVLMTKRWGGISKGYDSLAVALGINSRFLTRCPMLVREFFLQGIVVHAEQLTLGDKLRLCLWSLDNYIRVHGVPGARRALSVMVRRARGWWANTAGPDAW